MELELTDIADELRISTSNLEAIEAGDTSSLPSEMYFGLFAKSYAERLGIDYLRTMEAIKADIEEAGADSNKKSPDKGTSDVGRKADRSDDSPEGHTESSVFGRGLIRLIGLIVIVFGVFLTVYFIWFDSSEPVDQSAGTDREEQLSEDEQAGDDADLVNYDWDVTTLEKPEPMHLWLQSRQESWATVVADGDTVIYRTLAPWREFTVEAQHRLRISVGIPSRVSIKLNGQEVDLVDPETRRISRVEINQANISEFLARTASESPEERPASSGQEVESMDTSTTDSSGTI